MPATATEDADTHDLVREPLEAINDAESNMLLLQDRFAVLRERFQFRNLPTADITSAAGRAPEHPQDAGASGESGRGTVNPTHEAMLNEVIQRLEEVYAPEEEEDIGEDNEIRDDVFTLIAAVRVMVPDLSRAVADRAKLKAACEEAVEWFGYDDPENTTIAVKLRAALDAVNRPEGQ